MDAAKALKQNCALCYGADAHKQTKHLIMRVITDSCIHSGSNRVEGEPGEGSIDYKQRKAKCSRALCRHSGSLTCLVVLTVAEAMTGPRAFWRGTREPRALVF